MKALLSESIPSAIERERSLFDRLATPLQNKLVLFGAGEVGRRALHGLRRAGVEPLGFSDNNSGLWGKSVDELSVIPPNEAATKFGNNAAFVVTIYNGSSVRKQLADLGCARVVPFAPLFWKYAASFMPYLGLTLPSDLLAHSSQILAGFHRWADEESREEYVNQMRWRLSLDRAGQRPPSPREELYFPSDLASLHPRETFVDCGAFDGDTVRAFMNRVRNQFAGIIAIEPDRKNFEALCNFVSGLTEDIRKKIEVHQCAVGASRKTLSFAETGSAASRVAPEEGNVEVECIPLDQILHDRMPSYVKIDVEGQELGTLGGPPRVIEGGEAVWAIVLYHRGEDIWEIPSYIQTMSDGYDLYLRRYAEDCWELVCYAVPRRRMASAADVV